jgi:alpha-tubulin suppressor-like RCC1 family protein
MTHHRPLHLVGCLLALFVWAGPLSLSAQALALPAPTADSLQRFEWRVEAPVAGEELPHQIAALAGDVAAVSVAAGEDHSCALTAAGGVQCWGRNRRGQLGDGTLTDHATPSDVAGLGAGSGVVAIALGGRTTSCMQGGGGYYCPGGHTCSLSETGEVKCWGENVYGQLGDGTTTNRATPVVVSGLSAGSGVTAIYAGGNHTCAATETGAVMCWGRNDDGQIGDGSTTNRLVPVVLSGLPMGNGPTTISVGSTHTCGLTSEGGVKCWGANNRGQLGTHSTNQRTPVDVNELPAGSGVTAISAGNEFTCALVAGGLKCWGTNSLGELGDGTYTGRATLGDVTGLAAGSGVTSVTAGRSHTCALVSGITKCWGSVIAGSPSRMPLFTPVDIGGLAFGVAIVAGQSYTCVLTLGGRIQCWGDNSYGQLGDGTTRSRSTAVGVIGLSAGNDATGVSAGERHTCATANSGGVSCWGDNPMGALGDGTLASRYLPANVSGFGVGSDARAVVAGSSHSCALTGEGGVKCWGCRQARSCGTDTANLVPVDIPGLTSGVTAINSSEGHTCALTTTGGVKCWGNNQFGQLGDGTTTDRIAPVDVSGLIAGSGVTAIAAGSNHTCAVTASGETKCWGQNGSGQLGDSSTEDRTTPVGVSGLGAGSGVTAVSAGDEHTCALISDGRVKCWGHNGFGELGDGTTIDRTSPGDVSGFPTGSGVTAISAGTSHTCVLEAGGIKCWGSNSSGQLGDGTGMTRTTPVEVVGFPSGSGATAVDAGAWHSCAIQGGAVRCWGSNLWGQLGVNPGWTPVSVIGFGLPMKEYLPISCRGSSQR